MSSDNWTDLAGVANDSAIKRTATRATTPPNGGGLATRLVRSLTNTPGVYGQHCNETGFDPTDPLVGAEMTACMKRGVSGGTTGFAPFIFTLLQTNNVSGTAYILGLADAAPSHLVLRKAALNAGLPDAPAGSNGILARSTISFPVNTWVQVRLGAKVNSSGGIATDTVVYAEMSDLSVNPAGSPVWIPIPGIVDFIDDAAGFASGTPGLTEGRVGYAMYAEADARNVFFDHFGIIGDF